jgi:WhiB family transcriptional regulator, redox-sensing transcriptional regulator
MAKQPEVVQLAIQGKLELLDRELGMPLFFRDANCKDADPNLFFSESLSQNKAAKEVCFVCPIRQQCFSWAIENTDEGIYGGMTPGERLQFRRGAKILDLSEIREMKLQRDLILNSEINRAVNFFNVNERTIYRWRRLLAG